MARHLDAMPVSRIYGGLQLGARDIHVGLEGGDALGNPVLDRADSVLRPRELVHLGSESAGTFQIRASNIEPRTGHPARVDHALHVEVGIRLQAAGGAGCSDTACQIQSRKAEGMFVIDRDPSTRW